MLTILPGNARHTAVTSGQAAFSPQADAVFNPALPPCGRLLSSEQLFGHADECRSVQIALEHPNGAVTFVTMHEGIGRRRRTETWRQITPIHNWV